MLRISLLDLKVWPVDVVTVTRFPESVMLDTGVERRTVLGFRSAASPIAIC